MWGSSSIIRQVSINAKYFVMTIAKSLRGDFHHRLLEAFLDENDGRRRNAIDSIMNNRHLIAHGRSSSISVARVREYFTAINEVADFLERQCD